MYIGFWKEGKMHGYGKLCDIDGTTELGHWENSVLKVGTWYNPDEWVWDYCQLTDPIAQKVDFEKYLIRDGFSIETKILQEQTEEMEMGSKEKKEREKAEKLKQESMTKMQKRRAIKEAYHANRQEWVKELA